ncbi:hypothetical protein ACQKP7_15165 [Pseudomonas frederiksbergensis]|uniref:hypothetical protein n=1 Tax=Pseudomonas frederiksbergensis TaxID=104087 RepID=UPI003CFD28E2
MQTNQDSQSRNLSVPTSPTKIDETAYLLASKANAERLIKSINHIRAKKLVVKQLQGAAEGCDLLILYFGDSKIAEDQKIAAYGSSGCIVLVRLRSTPGKPL